MIKHDMDAFMKSCDMDHDGITSKTEMLKHVETVLDKMVAKTSGKLDSKRTGAFL